MFEEESSTMPKKTAAKKTTFGADLIDAMKLVLAHQRGELELEQVRPKRIAEIGRASALTVTAKEPAVIRRARGSKLKG
jgi:hypothetical protein